MLIVRATYAQKVPSGEGTVIVVPIGLEHCTSIAGTYVQFVDTRHLMTTSLKPTYCLLIADRSSNYWLSLSCESNDRVFSFARAT